MKGSGRIAKKCEQVTDHARIVFQSFQRHAQTEEQVTEFVSMPVRDAWRSAKKTAIANQTRIEAVAAALDGHAPPWELSHAEVVEILDKLD